MTFQTTGRRLSRLVMAAGAVLALSGCVAYPYGDPGGYAYGGYGYAAGPVVAVGPGYGYGYRPWGDRGDWNGGDRGGWSSAAQSHGASPPPPSHAGGGGVAPRAAPYRGAPPRSNPGGPDGGPSR